MEAPTKFFLPFDGTHIGDFEFSAVVNWIYPCSKTTTRGKTVTLFAILNLPNVEEKQYVILKRNRTNLTDQLVIDELKPIFGLKKMGTHTIKLKGIAKKHDKNYPWLVTMPDEQIITNVQIDYKWSDYLVFPATIKKDPTGKVDFVPLSSVGSTIWLPSVQSEIKEGHKKFYYEIQKILVFRDLMRISETNLNDIMIKNLLPLSIDEMVIKHDFKKLSDEIERFYFLKLTTRSEVMIKMLGLSKEDYQDKIEILRNSMINIIGRVDESKIWLVDDVTNQIIDRCNIYYKLMEDL